MRKFQLFCCTVLLAVGIQSASAFALLGPFAPWMYQVPGYVTNDNTPLPHFGGPMNIGQGYRWNIPVITYAYDKSFLNFYGSNGVAAVEDAIKMLNCLPAASTINLTNYPLYSTVANELAGNQNLLDLKTAALACLLEQMGLASPGSFVFCLSSNFDLSRDYQSIDIRNFDPVSLAPSITINGVLFDYENNPFGPYPFPTEIATVDLVGDNPSEDSLLINSVDPTQPSFNAVADGIGLYSAGIFYTGLTADDAGGLKYLLSSNNVALESLILGVAGVGTNAGNFVNRALRPGIEKITFQRLELDAITDQVFPFTNQYTDTYQTNGAFRQQTVHRVVTQPDIIFSGKYLNDSNFFYAVEVSGTDGWTNNGAPGQNGPGVIQPPAKITFNAFDQGLIDSGFGPYGSTSSLWSWGSFDDSTNAPLVYPVVTNTNSQTTLHLLLNSYPSAPTEIKTWNLSGASGALFHLQTSTNLTTWSNVMTITNIGHDATFMDSAIQPRYIQRFFRIVGQ